MWPISHFFLGYVMSLSLLVGVSALFKKLWSATLKEFILYRSLPASIGGLWAMLTDLGYFMSLENRRLLLSSLGDLFFFHYSADRYLGEDDLFVSSTIIALFAIANVLIVPRTTRSLETLRTVLYGEKTIDKWWLEEEMEHEEQDIDGGEEATYETPLDPPVKEDQIAGGESTDEASS